MNEQPLVTIAAFRAARGRDDELLDVVGANVAASHHEPGVLRLALHRDRDDARRFVAIEVYSNEAAFEAHRSSDHFGATVAVLPSLLDGSVESRLLDPVLVGDPTKGFLGARATGISGPVTGTGVVVWSTLRLRPGSERQVRAILDEDIVCTHKEPGVRRFTLHRDRDESHTLVVIEVFDDDAAIDAHFETPYLQQLSRDLPPLLEHNVEIVRLDPVLIGDSFKGSLAVDR